MTLRRFLESDFRLQQFHVILPAPCRQLLALGFAGGAETKTLNHERIVIAFLAVLVGPVVGPHLGLKNELIAYAGIFRNCFPQRLEGGEINAAQAGLIGTVQGICLPFRGFSRSGATISAGMLAGVAKSSAETFSFALAVVLTPAVVAREVLRLVQAERISGTAQLASAVLPSLIGAGFAFVAGLLALRWLTKWLEGGRWYLFGIYCLVAAAIAAALRRAGY